jgi:hypothetical protein
MSLDCDASDRTFDWRLAYLGLLADAAPLFREGSSVPGVGVLLALPCLLESKIFIPDFFPLARQPSIQAPGVC